MPHAGFVHLHVHSAYSLSEGAIKLDELITRYRPLDEINEAFEDMTNGVAARTILTFD